MVIPLAMQQFMLLQRNLVYTGITRAKKLVMVIGQRTLSPATNSDAYKKAQEALKVKEDLTFSDAEIDAFLPKELRRTKPPTSS